MSDVLSALLPTAAADLYQKLLMSGHIRLSDSPQLSESDELRQLVDQGFARVRYVDEPTVIPVEPARAIEHALLAAQRRMLDQSKLLIRAREHMELLQRSYLASAEPAESADGIQVLTDPEEIGRLSVELCLSARTDFSNLETAHFRKAPDPRSAKVPPAEVLERGVRFRNIYARQVFDIPGAEEMLRRCAEGGWSLRALPELPMKMVLVDDRAALLPLDPTGMTGAVLVRAPVIVAGLRTLFELLWNRATPVTADGGERLTVVQDSVLRLMVTGATDEAISRHLGISTRTVRRQIAALLELMGVDNRITAAAVAVREGWID
jgi:DNA-binding CsgD family transcriptional regulator